MWGSVMFFKHAADQLFLKDLGGTEKDLKMFDSSGPINDQL